MKKWMIALVFVLMPVLGNATGIGLSYYKPTVGNGGLGFGSGVGLGIGKYLSINGRADYYGLKEMQTTDTYCTSGWFSTNSLLMNLYAKIDIPLNRVTPYIEGGWAYAWNFGLHKNDGFIDRDLLGTTYTTATNYFSYDNKLAKGWSIGGGVKIQLGGKMAVNIGVRYQKLRAPLNIRGNYVAASSSAKASDKTYTNSDSELKMDGINVFVGVSF